MTKSNGTAHPAPSQPKESPYAFFQQWIAVLTVLTTVGLIVFATMGEDATPQDVTMKHSTPGMCDDLCAARFQQRLHRHGTNLLDTKALLKKVQEAKAEMYEMMKSDYGPELFQAIFFKDGVSRGKASWFSADSKDTSVVRFQRKLKMKVLQMQMNLLESERSVGSCDCSHSVEVAPEGVENVTVVDTESARRLEGANDTMMLPHLPAYFNRFVWSTGGHSAAAGHGNLYNESYTSFMERAAKNVFAAVGIDLEGRNYAMGGMASAPELALCNQAIYGPDADIVSWDFGMTDGRAYHNTYLYASRSGIHPNRPMHVTINVDGRGYQHRIAQIAAVEEQGMPAMYLLRTIWEELKPALPDMFGMSYDDMNEIPLFARHFKCSGAIEKGDPTCGRNKYNENICPNRRFKAGWHPGWYERLWLMLGDS